MLHLGKTESDDGRQDWRARVFLARRRSHIRLEPSMTNISQRDFTKGNSGIVTVDRIGELPSLFEGNKYKVVKNLEVFSPRIHDLFLSQNGTRAYVPIYRDGIRGKNPCRVILSLVSPSRRKNTLPIGVCPRTSPHMACVGEQGPALFHLQNRGVVMELDPLTGKHESVMGNGSDTGHCIEITPMA